MAGVRAVPNDPTRPVRILDAALEVIAELGLHRASHQRIADAAGVSPGSLTYYYSGIDDIHVQSFKRMFERMSFRYDQALRGATCAASAAEAIADLIFGEYAEPRFIVLIFEMYAYANHSDEVASFAVEWTHRSKRSLSLHFSPAACRAIDALVEGWPMHRKFGGQQLDRDEIIAAIKAIDQAFPQADRSLT